MPRQGPRSAIGGRRRGRACRPPPPSATTPCSAVRVEPLRPIRVHACTSEQRVRWFMKGLESGDISQGDTFSCGCICDSARGCRRLGALPPVRYTYNRKALSTTTTVDPSWATTAIPSEAIPIAAAGAISKITPRAIHRFCMMIRRLNLDKLDLASGSFARSWPIRATSAVSRATSVPAPALATATVGSRWAGRAPTWPSKPQTSL